MSRPNRHVTFERCPCGASIHAESQADRFVVGELAEFRRAHQACREAAASRLTGRRAADAAALGQSVVTTENAAGGW